MLQPRLSRSALRLQRPTALHRRTLWHTSTLISPSPSALLRHLESTSTASLTASSEKGTATLWALSKNTPQELVPAFRRALDGQQQPSAGCLSEVLPSSLVAQLAPSLSTSASADTESFSLSLARWIPGPGEGDARVFRSALVGRPNIALGREIKPESMSYGSSTGVPGGGRGAGGTEEDEAFKAFLRGEKWGFGGPPVAKTTEASEGGLEELRDVDPKTVSQLVCFTADRIQPFLSALSAYPQAATAGLVGSSTPFHSPLHAPYSLFLNGEEEVHSTGAVGVAIVGGQKGGAGARTDYGGLEMLGTPMEVTSSRGNIVLTLSAQNAARTLLAEVNTFFGTSEKSLSALERSEEKEKEFYAAVFSQQPVLYAQGTNPDLAQATLVARIMAGDPSRGAMSVETELDVPEGHWLVFLHRPSTTSSPLLSPSPSSLTFLTLPPSHAPPHFSASECPSTGDVIELKGWLAVSENGVVHAVGAGAGGGGGRRAVCAIEGAGVRLE
ncbi:hypothetical protein JCM8097_002371 [Rhodosporidiobolus ruineniae]